MAVLLLSISTYSFQKRGLEGGVPWFQLPLFFGVSDKAKVPFITLSLDSFSAPSPYGMIKIHILDGSVMQQIVPMIPGCV